MNLTATLLFIGTGEIIFILFVVVMVFGADKIPEVARGLGKGMRQLRDATNDIKGEITKGINQVDVKDDVTKNITGEINKIKDDLEDFTGSIKRGNRS
ncbi:MAG TPA: twin-arginine translocase TatA/TatE family subunit [Aquaticitalea sp.]|nr:twin-arginine translocase TatA/TatE family subunit [Aquaticitalea sp.]